MRRSLATLPLALAAVLALVPARAQQAAPTASAAAGLTIPALLALPQPAAGLPALTVPAPAGCTLSSCSGFYARAGLTGIGTNADIIGNGLNNSVFAAGSILDVGAGYQFWNGTYFAAAEVSAGFQTSSNGAAGAVIGPGSFVGIEQVKVGGALSGLLGQASPATTAPGQAPTSIAVPGFLSQSLLAPYMAIGAMQRGGQNVMVTGAGAEFVLASGISLDLEYLYAPPMSSEPASNLIRLGLQYHF